jgi:hypothetical protein
MAQTCVRWESSKRRACGALTARRDAKSPGGGKFFARCMLAMFIVRSVFHHALRAGRDLTQTAHHATQTMPTRAKNQTKNVGEAADAGVPTRPTHAHKKGDAPQAGSLGDAQERLGRD